MDSRKRQTSTATPAEPGGLPLTLGAGRKEPRSGPNSVHELKLDGYRIHARIDRGEVKLLTRDAVDTWPLPLLDRKAKLAELLEGAEMSAFTFWLHALD